MTNKLHPLAWGVTICAIIIATSTILEAGSNKGSNDDDRRQINPLVLKGQGSFYVGGRLIHTDAANGDTPQSNPRDGTIAIEQMYVRYQAPLTSDKRVPVVLIHGGSVSSQCYETTPDGRMGWDEYFVRKGRVTYLVDQAARSRSSFDVSPFNRVRLGLAPPQSQPAIRVLTKEQAWTLFRFWPTVDTPFRGQQFPLEAIGELLKGSAPPQNSNSLPHLSELAQKVGGAILVSHSQSGLFPQNTALQVSPKGIRGIVTMEPAGGCGSTTLTPDQIKALAQIPYLAVFGDFIKKSTATLNWPAALADCESTVQKLKAAGGDATLIQLPDVGINGNSHMLMQDKNNLQVADLILKWIDKHVKPRKGDHHHDDGHGHGWDHARDDGSRH